MDNIYRINSTCLKENHNEVWECLSIEKENHELVNVCDLYGKSVLSIIKKDIQYQLDTLFNSNELTDLWYLSVKDKISYGVKCIVFGFGNGMFVKKLLEIIDENSEVIVYEPSRDIFKTVLCTYDISKILCDKRFSIVVGDDNTDNGFRVKLLKSTRLTDINNNYVSVYPNYRGLFGDEYERFNETIEYVFTCTLANAHFMSAQNKILAENMSRNTCHFIDSKDFKSLLGCASNVPGIVVGAGPSLDKNVTYLSGAKDKSIIIATDSAVATLRKNGIRPDMIVSVDPTKNSEYLGEDVFEDVPMFCSLHSGWKMLDAHKGIKFFNNTPGVEHVKYFNDCNNIDLYNLDADGSVANIAFQVAVSLGCYPIILVGQDLSYPGNETHAKDSIVSNRTVEELNGNLLVKDIWGNFVRTSDDMNRYREWIENQISYNSGLMVYDATEGGAFIKGTHITSLEEVIQNECSTDFLLSTRMDKIRPLFDERKSIEFIKYLNGIPNKYDEERENVRKILLDYGKMKELVGMRKYHTGEMVRLSKKTNALLSEIEEDPLLDYARLFAQDRINNIYLDVNKKNNNIKEEMDEIIKSGMEYAMAIREGIDLSTEVIKWLIEEINGNRK